MSRLASSGRAGLPASASVSNGLGAALRRGQQHGERRIARRARGRNGLRDLAAREPAIEKREIGAVSKRTVRRGGAVRLDDLDRYR